MLRRRLAFPALLTAVAALVAAAPAASAAGNPYSPVRVCGGAYHVIDHHDLRGPKGGLLGTVYLLWSGATKKNCVVTIKRRAVGVPTFVKADLARKGGRYQADDSLDYRYYAGPVYAYAPHTCIIWGGGMNDAKGNGTTWITPRFNHCR